MNILYFQVSCILILFSTLLIHFTSKVLFCHRRPRIDHNGTTNPCRWLFNRLERFPHPEPIHAVFRLHKPVSDCIIEMERNDLWLNVKGNYLFFKGKIISNLD